jgi:hypothetical protein
VYRLTSAQRVVKWALWLLAGGLALGALLDSVSNAISLVSPATTYISTAVLVTLWFFLEATARLFGIPWVSHDRRSVRIKRLGSEIRFGIIGVLLLLWVPRLGDLPKCSRQIPPVTVLLENSTDSTILVARRGDLVVWLPNALYDGAPRIGGAFTFVVDGERGYVDSAIVVRPHTPRWVKAHIHNQHYLYMFMEREDTELSLHVGTSTGLTFSPNIPFTEAALSSRYIGWDVSEE